MKANRTPDRGFWVRSNFLSDQNYTFDVMFNDEEVYNALDQLDAFDAMKRFSGVLGATHMKQCDNKAWMARPLWERLNMMSHEHGYDSPKAQTLSEAASIARAALARAKGKA